MPVTQYPPTVKNEMPPLFEGGILHLKDAKPSKPISRLWYGFYKSKVTLFIGETGAGKSSLFRLLSLHAALNQPLWDIPFELERPINVLYVDPENMGDASQKDGGLTADRMDSLKLGRPVNLILHSGTLGNGQALNLSNASHMNELTEFVKKHKIDLLILDPYASLFSLTSENDNAEATKNMVALKDLARTADCAVVLCHHTGKVGEENSSNAKYGRGASALLAAADVGITFRLRSSPSEEQSDEEGKSEENDRRDYVRLKIEKNRVGFGYTSLYLQMIGEGQFRRVSSAEFFKAGSPDGREVKRETQEQDSRRIFLDILKDFEEHGRTEMINAAANQGISKENASRVFTQLVESNEVSERRGGRNKSLCRLVKDNPHFFSASASAEGVKYQGNWTPEPKSVTAEQLV